MWCGFIPLLTRRTETCYQKASITQTLRHTYPPAPLAATVLAVSKSSFQERNNITAAGDISLPAACGPAALRAACPVGQSRWRDLTQAWVACQETAGGTQRCWGAGRRASWRLWEGFRDGLHPSEPKVMGFVAKQMDFTGRRGRPPEEGEREPTPNTWRAP